MVVGMNQLVNVSVERLALDSTGSIASTWTSSEGEGSAILGPLNGTSMGANETTVE